MTKKLTIEEVEERIKKIHGDTVTIVKDSYKGTAYKAIFIDKDFGEWYAKPSEVFKYGHIKRGRLNLRYTWEELKLKIYENYGDTVTIIEEPYKDVRSKAKFIDKDFGIFECRISSILGKVGNHTKRTEKNNIEKFGFSNPLFNTEIRMKGVKTAGKSYTAIHWKTKEELLCQGTWEVMVIDYLNANKIDFLWQPQTFIMPEKKRYTPDLFLIDTQTWVEIKGYFRGAAKIKWEWFKTIYPTAELWDGPKLKEMRII